MTQRGVAATTEHTENSGFLPCHSILLAGDCRAGAKILLNRRAQRPQECPGLPPISLWPLCLLFDGMSRRFAESAGEKSSLRLGRAFLPCLAFLPSTDPRFLLRKPLEQRRVWLGPDAWLSAGDNVRCAVRADSQLQLRPAQIIGVETAGREDVGRVREVVQHRQRHAQPGADGAFQHAAHPAGDVAGGTGRGSPRHSSARRRGPA